MEKCIINKIEYINGEVVYTPVGYTTDMVGVCEVLNADHDSTLGAWVETNKTELETGTKFISEFFDSTPFVHIAKTGVNYLVDLPEITNINQL